MTATTDAAIAFQKFVEIIAKLRDPVSGCPWDIKQTHASLKPYMIEEAYEVIDAIDHSPGDLAGELGDVLLQVVLHSQVATDSKTFTIKEVIEGISEKMVTRHPHVFGDVQVKDADDVVKNWQAIKQQEKASKGEAAPKGVLDGIPRSLPALLKSLQIGERAARVGFEWRSVEEVQAKVLEEVKEFAECPPQDKDELENELGDIFFALGQLARRLNIDPEACAQRANDKFCRRFRAMEAIAGPDMASMGVEKLDQIWNQVKAAERKG
jgi:MazG family protein